MAYIILKTKCPYCDSINCYNSGFTIECVNYHCKFYNEKHHKDIQKQIAAMREKEAAATEKNKNKLAEQTHNPVEEEYDDDYDSEMLAAYGYPGFKIV